VPNQKDLIFMSGFCRKIKLWNICAKSMTHFLASHEKMCQISYKISLFWMATMVARKMSQTLGTYALENSSTKLNELSIRQSVLL
jgi:hypothetical protein